MANVAKCPYCGGGWAGKGVSPDHVASCQQKHTSIVSASAGGPKVRTGIPESSGSPGIPSIADQYARFQAEAAFSATPAPPPKDGMKMVGVPDGDNPITIEIYRDGKRVGYACFVPSFRGRDMVLKKIEVSESHRRQGLALNMWNQVKELGFEPVMDSFRLPDGEAFAQSVGAPCPPNAYEHAQRQAKIEDPEAWKERDNEFQKSVYEWEKARGEERPRSERKPLYAENGKYETWV